VMKRMKKEKAQFKIDFSHFPYFVNSLANIHRNTVFIDQCELNTETRESLLQTLEEHISNNIIRVNKGFYRQLVGIPQGSIVSTFLCNLFYAELERVYLQRFLGKTEFLARWVDDFLFITPNRNIFIDFIKIMFHGFPEYGCFINHEKTVVNCDVQFNNTKLQREKEKDGRVLFSWCGMLIDDKNLNVINNIATEDVRDSLNVAFKDQPGTIFAAKLAGFLKVKCHALFFDEELNDYPTIVTNVHNALLITAHKTHYYWIQLTNFTRQKNYHFLFKTIVKTIEYFHELLISRAKSLNAKTNRARITISQSEVLWIGLFVYIKVFGHLSKTRYATIIELFQQALNNQTYAPIKAKLTPILIALPM